MPTFPEHTGGEAEPVKEINPRRKGVRTDQTLLECITMNKDLVTAASEKEGGAQFRLCAVE